MGYIKKLTQVEREVAWMLWGGGKMPVDDYYAAVEVILRCGSRNPPNPAGRYRWEHRDTGDDIVAWRPYYKRGS